MEGVFQSTRNLKMYLKDNPAPSAAELLEMAKHRASKMLMSAQLTLAEFKEIIQLIGGAGQHEESLMRMQLRERNVRVKEEDLELRKAKAVREEARAQERAEAKKPRRFDNSARIAELRKTMSDEINTPDNVASLQQMMANAKAGYPDPRLAPPGGWPEYPPGYKPTAIPAAPANWQDSG